MSGKDYKKHYYRLIAGAVIHKGNKVLIGKKDPNKPHPARGQWVFPAGYVEERENPFETIVREIKEETGLKVRVNGVVDFVSMWNIWKDKNMLAWYTFIYFDCPYVSGTPKASDDLFDLKWVKAKDLNKYLTSRRPPKGSRLEAFIKSLG